MKKLLIILAALMCGGPAIAQQALPPVPLNVGTNGSQTLTVGDCLKILSIGVVGTVATDSGGPCGAGTPAFSAITPGTNTGALVVGTGGSLAVSGGGTIAASSAPVAGISGLGTGIATFLATPSSANFAAAVTGETGTGSLVFATSPTFVTPALGVVASGDVSAATSLATGSVTGRSLAARAAEVYNVLDWCAAVCTSASVQDTAVSAAVTAINAAGGGQLYFPPGLSWAITTQHVFTTYAASLVGGGINTTTILTNGGAGFEWTTATSQSNGGHCSIHGFRMFQNDNATTGAQILLNNVDFCTLYDLQLGGGFISLDIASSVAVTISHLIIEGHNSTSGSMAMRIHKTNSGAGNSSEIEMNDFDIRADASGTLTYGIRVSDSDGLYVGNGHVGFGASAGILIQAENTTDQLDGILFDNVNVDTTSTGPEVDIETLAGQTGADGGNGFTGGSIANSAAAGVLMNDTNASNWKFTGVDFNSNGTHGLDIEAGNGVSVVGGGFVCNNRSAASANHINMGGNASWVTVQGVLFQQGIGSRCSNAVVDDILVGGTTTDFQIGKNLYGTGGTPVSITSTGVNLSNETLSSLTISGNLSTASALTNGIGLVTSSPIYTDSSGTGGTIANSYMFALPAAQLRTTTNTTYSNVYGLYVPVPTCGAGGGGTATCTSLGGIITNGSITSQSGAILTGGNTIINNGGSVTTTINAGSNSGTVTIGNSTGPNTTNLSSPTINMANIASSSAAQTGTVCRGTGGLLTYDTTTTCLASDGRLKMNIEPLDVGVSEIMKLRPVSYELKPQFDPTHLGRQVGLIAQDVMAVDPRLAATYQSGPDVGTPSGVRYEQMVALLVKSVQEQQHEIDGLKRQLRRHR